VSRFSYPASIDVVISRHDEQSVSMGRQIANIEYLFKILLGLIILLRLSRKGKVTGDEDGIRVQLFPASRFCDAAKHSIKPRAIWGSGGLFEMQIGQVQPTEGGHGRLPCARVQA
jgi:hypothetical protein